MKNRYIGVAASILLFPIVAAAQDDFAPLPVTTVQEQPSAMLPANTELRFQLNQDLTTKGQSWNEGDTFSLSLAQDVIVDGFVVIPRGSRGVGRITWLTSKGAFGKSGKMDIELEYVEVAGRRIDIEGTYRQEGEGNTVATVGGVIAAGVFAGFITGKSATIPRGRELVAYTERDMPLAMPSANGQLHSSTGRQTPIQVAGQASLEEHRRARERNSQ